MATDNNKSWWKKALFDSEAGGETSQPTQTVSQPTPTTKVNTVRKPSPVFSAPTPTPTVVDDGEVDESYINHLYDFMTKNNFPGPDYYEFANSLDEMTSELAGASEEKIFQMTYKVAYKQNLPVPTLIETAQKYVQLFTQHKKEFDDYLNSESQKTVGVKVDENTKLQKSNDDSSKKIEDLRKQIETMEVQIETNNTKIEENNVFIESESQKLVIKKSKFEKAFNIIITKINDDISKIKQYLTTIK